MDHLEAIRTESARFSQAAHQLDLATPVPSCPDWASADLVHHLAEVQDFWSQVVRGADGEDATDLPRPADDAALPDAYDAASGRLVAALEQADPAGSCWSWHEDGHSIAWVLRRQAHEVLVHRVDAELAAGTAAPRPPVVPGLALDGVDEVLTVMVDGVPQWGEFSSDGRLIGVAAHEGETSASWTFRLGRFTGAGPETGKEWDLPAGLITQDVGFVDRAPVVRGPAWDLDLWLWGRGPLPAGAIGDRDAVLAETFRSMVAAATQ